MSIIKGKRSCQKCGGQGHVERQVMDEYTNRIEPKIIIRDCMAGIVGDTPDI
jgi:hypothetical protein